MIYFISDTHFNHINIIKYCNRPFEDVTKMNSTIINNWNKVVTNNDEIYHLGDLTLGRKEQFFEIANKLNGKKYLIRGNHDTWRINIYEEFGFTVLKNPPIILKEYRLVLSHTPIQDKQIPDGYINIHGHIHNKSLEECMDKYDLSKFSVKKHINISCDVTNYSPISLEKLMEKVS